MKTQLTQEEQEQNIEALKAFWRGEPIECQRSYGEWYETDNTVGINQLPHRPAPFNIVSHIERQFGPLEGRRFHREDFTREMLPEGWRPRLNGEGKPQEFECLHNSPHAIWGPYYDGGIIRDESEFFFRTTRLLPDPYAELQAAHRAGKVIRYRDGAKWYETKKGELLAFTNPPDWYEIKPEPKLIPWTRETCPPLPFEVVSKFDGSRCAVVGADATTLRVSAHLRTYDQVFRDFTLPNRQPCGTEVKP